jgi:glycosyltransferase involved in cell wall biosynthesis
MGEAMTNLGTDPGVRPPAPMTSIIIPFLNPAPFLEEAIQSVFAQTYPDWELLLVDDGSTDGSAELARGYAEKHPDRIFYLEHSGHLNRGTPASRNLGIRNASGKYIAFLDSDDVWMPDKLASQTALLEARPDVVMTYGPCLLWYSWSGDNQAKKVQDTPQHTGIRGCVVFAPPELLKMEIQDSDMLLSPSGMLVRRGAAIAAEGFAERFCGRIQMYEDHSFYSKLTIGENVLISDQPCFKYRQHPESCVSGVIRSGIFDNLRIDFLLWLSDYLGQAHPSDTEIRAVIAKEVRLLRVRSMRASCRNIARRITPRFLRDLARSNIASFRAHY